MKAIVNIDKNWGIGREGDQPFYIPEDLKFFQRKTSGKIIVMGRATLMALPNGAPLKNRVNVVLTRQQDFAAGDAIICHSFEDLHKELAAWPPDDIFVIGGAEIYAALLDFCTKVYVTKIHAKAACDRHFPNLDKMENWQLHNSSEIKAHEGLEFQFCEYINTNPKSPVH
ncbi:MAG: dihydrofolate reductase [Defluviitaleaceae bacterium]|nr:dihydrofolate reductase [Defluviitaleaceae bacterium]